LASCRAVGFKGERMTPIKPFRPSPHKEDFGQKLVEKFWLEIPAVPPSVSHDKDYLTKITDLLDSAAKDAILCVFSEGLSCKPLCKSLENARDNGSRIYILTNAYHPEMKNLEGCLIRYGGSKRLGSFILVNPNSNGHDGCLLTGPLSVESINLPANLLLDLDNAQISTLFRYFCYQFWNKAEKEYIGEEHDTSAAPIDIHPPTDDSCDFQYLKTVWDEKTDNALITTSLLTENSYLRFSNFSNSAVHSLFSGIDNNLVHSLKQNNNEIYAYKDSVFINSLKTSDDVWLIPKTNFVREEEVYAIKLNSEQANVLDKHIIALSQEKAKYQYFASEKREKLSAKTIIDSSSKEVTIKAQSTINLGEISLPELLPRDDFENHKPDFADDDRSVSITYEWTNIPYTLPSGSKKHQLYINWENTKKNIIKYIDNILNDISENEKRESKISKLINLFYNAKKQNFSDYQKELENLKTIKYGFIEKSELEKHIKRINEIRKFVDKDSSEIEEENRKAGIEEKIKAKQEEIKKCEKERDDKERELQEKQKEIETKSAEQEALQKEEDSLTNDKKVNELKKQLENLKAAENKITNERDKKNKEIKELNNNINSLNDQLTSPVKANQSNKSSVQEETERNMEPRFINILKRLVKEQSKTTLTDAKRCKALLADYTKNDYKKESKWIVQAVEAGVAKAIDGADDLAACKKAKIRDLKEEAGLDPTVAEKIVNTLALVLRDETTVTASPFAEKAALVVQELPHLPHVGELYKNGSETYLAITDWDDYDNSKEEAKRLQATLCAKGENNN
jgi:hypothetical protein